ncbi:MAG: Gfo/Idh/MocA family oxidoreductase [Bacteroidetes bacterium]|nr:Gfo/Idh/MocA family oxidoreductase [Bacteroidota bacterium]MCL6103571.1 Gfo/Idh/MocA family oxidoreductase [Bacteroidota bacterium]
MTKPNRREFILTTAISGIGLSVTGATAYLKSPEQNQGGNKIGIIGLDTSHSVAFTKALNRPEAGDEFSGYKVVAAYPNGSRDIASSVERIPGYTAEVQKSSVEIVNSIDELLAKVDVVMLETNDGRLHLEQALPVLRAGKRMFIDKPMTASLADAIAIFKAAKNYKVPVFSSSSLRYITGMDEIIAGKIGRVLGAETYSPAKLEATHPDLFWYGIHGVETLFTAMGTGCKHVVRVSNEDTDLVVGTWQDGRIGTFRGIRKGKADYGGTVFGEKGIKMLGSFTGYNPLLVQIIKFFVTGIAPVKEEETLEILAFMEAADLSKAKNGASADLETVMAKAMATASDIKTE